MKSNCLNDKQRPIELLKPDRALLIMGNDQLFVSEPPTHRLPVRSTLNSDLLIPRNNNTLNKVALCREEN